MADSKGRASESVNLIDHTKDSTAAGPDRPSKFSTTSTAKPTDTATITVQNTGSSTSTNPFRRHKATASQDGSPSSTPTLQNGSFSPSRNLSPTLNGSPTSPQSPKMTTSPRGSMDSTPRTTSPRAMASATQSTRPRRSSSLRDKYPDDPSVYPLNTLTAANKAAHRSPHLRKQHHQGSDSIDILDDAALFGGYHHEGPYDAASLARNNSYRGAPVAALAESNREALRATPRESVKDSIERHRPLDNVAVFPPGTTDELGRRYEYRQGPGEDLMRDPDAEGGAYKRYAGVNYHPDDLKGKGEPSYSIEKQLKDHKRRISGSGADGNAVELADRSRAPSTREYADGVEPVAEEPRELSPRKVEAAGGSNASASALQGQSHRREGSGSGLEGLKRRIGSLRHKDK